jgi:hypothetical protein
MPFEDGTYIETTIGQLNFFKWALENRVLDHIESNRNHIEADMSRRNSTARNKPAGEKQTRRRRQELSVSATKAIRKEDVEITVKFGA